MDDVPLTSFDPAADSDSFRATLGRFPTGVTAITTDSPDGPVAIIANSFASVSLDPPLVLWSPAKASHRFEYFVNSRRFAVNVLAADQRDICTAILKSKTAITDIPHHLSHCGMPLINQAVASFECTLHATHDAGDHVIIVGEVTKCHHTPGAPMVFHAGGYSTLNDG